MIACRNMASKPVTNSGTNNTGISFETRQFGRVFVLLSSYKNGGRPAVVLMDLNREEVTVLSVNIPNASHLLSEDEFFAKTWSENEEIAQDALASGVFQDTGRSSGETLCAPIWSFK